MTDQRARLARLRAERRKLQDRLDTVDGDLDVMLADMRGSMSVIDLAELVGVSRQEVHRRIARARSRA